MTTSTTIPVVQPQPLSGAAASTSSVATGRLGPIDAASAQLVSAEPLADPRKLEQALELFNNPQFEEARSFFFGTDRIVKSQ